ncbi:hypothetical protein BDW22DRAFT_1471872 [Trametopsis cervina]|nr:hypothetical protein BDW22DRAFT_1471872 [Trametopsis cervina]
MQRTGLTILSRPTRLSRGRDAALFLHERNRNKRGEPSGLPQQFPLTLRKLDSLTVLFSYAKRKLETVCSSRLWGPHASAVLTLSPTNDAPSLWLALVALIGFPLALWGYKAGCLMMVIFQRKIIYMGYVPPGARSEELNKGLYSSETISCEEIQLAGDSNVRLHGLLVRRALPLHRVTDRPKVVVLYFQGNAGNPLHRLPLFERLLSGVSLSRGISSSNGSILEEASVLAVAPRSYWKSSRRTPTEQGILTDYLCALKYTSRRFPLSPIILYGHSLGGAAAVCLAHGINSADFPNVTGMILENPFASIPGMVQAIYPQRWLPYRYLGVFAFDRWDALREMQSLERPDSLLDKLKRSIMVVLSENDEIVPNDMGKAFWHFAQLGGSQESTGAPLGRIVNIPGALHDDAWTKRQWQKELDSYMTAAAARHQAQIKKPIRL